MAAAAGSRVEHGLLAEVANLGEAELLAGLREAVSAHVAGRRRDGAYGFRHALVKEAVYAELLPGERTRLHARFAAALAARDGGGDPGLAAELAWHWYAAHDLERPCRRRSRPAWPPSAPAPSPRPSASSSAPSSCGSAAPTWGSARAGWTRRNCWPGRARRPPTPGPPTGRGPAPRRPGRGRSRQGPLLAAAQLTERLAFHLRIAGRPGAFEAYQEAVRLVPPEPSVAGPGSWPDSGRP